MKTKKIIHSQAFWILLFIFTLLWGYSLNSFLKLSDKNYVGPIVSLSSGSLVIEDGKEGQKEIMYDTNTKIFSPGKNNNSLEPGTPIFVEVRSRKETPLQARFIRILPKKK